MKISLFGLTVESENKGCEALFYSFMDLLSENALRTSRNFEVFAFSFCNDKGLLPRSDKKWNNLSLNVLKIGLKDSASRAKMIQILKESDACFDFTEGDSFTDLYGLKRFSVQTLVKTIAVLNTKKFVLGPQTHGPFTTRIAKMWAKFIYKKSFMIFSRDEDSIPLIKKISGRDAYSSTDIAMALVPEKTDFEPEKSGINLGINVSGLLYNGGYTGDNQFGLKADYKKYITMLLQEFSKRPGYNIYLIPHVINEDYDSCENDLKICELLKEKHPDARICCGYSRPGQIKDVISKMDIFTGARMHSTVGAYSTNVPVIPLSYSKKFQGLYGFLNYDFVVDAKALSTEECVKKTIDFIEQKELLKAELLKTSVKMREKVDFFKTELEKILR